MKKTIVLPLIVALGLGVTACKSKEASQVEQAADNRADAIDNAADHAATDTQADTLHNQADAVRESGENAADAIDNGSAANASNAAQ
jgi:hypothetical protein